MLRSGSAEVAGMFVSSSLAQPIVSLFFALPFNNLLHNLLLQVTLPPSLPPSPRPPPPLPFSAPSFSESL